MKYLKNPWTPFKFNNKFIKLPVARGMTFNLFHLHQDWMTFLLKRLTVFQNEDEYFLDIGANVGQTLINFHTVNEGKKYVAIEPDIYCIIYLKRLIELNDFKNSLVVPVGISDENKILQLYSSSITDAGATFRKDLRPDRESQLFSSIVPTFKLDDVVKHLNLKAISLLKMDVEGWELEVLKSMKNIFKVDRPIVICEVLFRDLKASPETNLHRNKEMLKILKEFEYGIFQLIKTQNLKDIEKIKETKEFSNEFWTNENKDLCDYLFIPAEKKELVNQIFNK
jgi:FkbM family methyltransferase